MLTNAISQADLRAANETLLSANALLTEELVALKKISEQKDFYHSKQMSKCAEDSHLQGHVAAVEEMNQVWSSKEFAAELMYGKSKIRKMLTNTSTSQGEEDKHTVNTTRFAG